MTLVRWQNETVLSYSKMMVMKDAFDFCELRE